MKLKKIEPQTTSRQQSEPLIGIGRTGMFQFNKFSLKALHMEGDKSISFFQDQEDKQNWYMEIAGTGDLKIRYYGDSKGPCVQSSSIAKEIKLSTRNDPEKTLRVQIGKPINHGDTILYPLLIQNGSHMSRT